MGAGHSFWNSDCSCGEQNEFRKFLIQKLINKVAIDVFVVLSIVRYTKGTHKKGFQQSDF